MAGKPRTPSGLGDAGRALWRRLVGVFEFAEHELALLEVACRQADDVAALEALIREQGLVVEGSAGQQRLSAAVTEVRQGRLALAKILGALALPDENDKPMTESARRAQHAARARWGQVRALEERRAGQRRG